MGDAGHAPIRNAASHSVGSKAANHPAAAQGLDGATNRFGDDPNRCKRFIAKSQPSDFHARCATEAQKLFQEAGHDANVNPLVSPIAPVSRHYQSHYNTPLKKCLMLLEENQYVANQVATSATLIDTDDRYLYAFYLYVWSAEEDKGGLQNSPAMCELNPDLQTKI